jgi:hypothetical protein
MFTSWSGASSGSENPLNVLMDSDKTITATFSPLPVYQLTVRISGEGSVSPAGGSYLSNSPSPSRRRRRVAGCLEIGVAMPPATPIHRR